MAIEHAPADDATVKKSVTIPRSLAREVEARTGARGFSRFVSEAIAHALALTKTREIVEDYEREHGPFTAEEIEEARRAWHGE
ncbi:hypothetical protein SRB5_38980 [Streptomyces sp. RB5]|uniref:CopG family transcriptional regulator n=1 Tax=Streptomyces smaragdinus TaxID=2585196 RepID=A0A7K0CJW7_9ACTN|nr:hypothetical protein [Streptomyces smaragdinus]MQY13746.1 hypothetical protein [Streptomyces smaragdinus]